MNYLNLREKMKFVFGQVLNRNDIIKMVINKFPDTNNSSIVPSDYCYNIINKDPNSFQVHLFESKENGLYVWLGSDYNYNGYIFWKGKIVGHWKEGIYTLYKDPRKKQ